MRLAVLTGLFACAVVFMLRTENTSASTLDILITNKDNAIVVIDEVAKTEQRVLVGEVEAVEPEPTPEPITHTVVEGENLSKIAETYSTTWQRLYDKNTEVEQPDRLFVGQVLLIPTADEVLESRPLPQIVLPQPQPVRTASQKTVNVPMGDSSGNRYVRGYCTWYVKNRRPDLPNNLGNAITWASRASAQGIATGSTPVVGAVGQQGNHVVYVEAVHGDGTVTVSEMNWDGWNVISTRTVSAANFTYIY